MSNHIKPDLAACSADTTVHTHAHSQRKHAEVLSGTYLQTNTHFANTRTCIQSDTLQVLSLSRI